MAKIPRIDLTDLLSLLKNEGKNELREACTKALGGKGQKILTEWDNIVRGLEEIIPKLAEGVEAECIKAQVKSIGKSALALSEMASQALSFVPGPVGMVCSFINAIVCFCTLPFPVNLANGFLELLGCIPGGKIVSKLAPSFEKILVQVIKKSGLRDILVSKGGKRLMNFIEKKLPSSKPPSSPSIKPQANGIGHYGKISKNSSSNFGDIVMQNKINTGYIKKGMPYGPNYNSVNYQDYIIRSNMGKNYPYWHLGY